VERLLAHDNSFELALLDDMLHDDVSGFEIAKELANAMSSKRIIMVTGNVSASRLREIREAGFELLIKPIDYYVLRQALLEALAG
jgi:DNA-binding response OmpR family regulator